VIVARYENAVKDAFNRLEKASQKMGLMIMISIWKQYASQTKRNT
jgi:hypothetical protein